MPRAAARATLDDIHPTVISTVQACANKDRWPLYLWGPTGRGKTCAAAVMFSLWKPSAVWISLTELCDTLKVFNVTSTQLLKLGTQYQEFSLAGYWKRLRETGLVVLDEIGTRDATAHRYDALLRLLEVRQSKPLIITGNLNPVTELVAVYDERIQSRLSAGVLLEVAGRDRRMDGIDERIQIAD
jgi:DNA replication protein DnaC